MIPMRNIAVIGDIDSVIGFKAIGLQVEVVTSVEEAKEALHRLAKDNYMIVYLTEQLAVDMAQDLRRYADRPQPAVILIPGQSALGIAMENIGRSVERAVGANILKD